MSCIKWTDCAVQWTILQEVIINTVRRPWNSLRYGKPRECKAVLFYKLFKSSRSSRLKNRATFRQKCFWPLILLEINRRRSSEHRLSLFHTADEFRRRECIRNVAFLRVKWWDIVSYWGTDSCNFYLAIYFSRRFHNFRLARDSLKILFAQESILSNIKPRRYILIRMIAVDASTIVQFWILRN